jgi:hypothetical protein
VQVESQQVADSQSGDMKFGSKELKCKNLEKINRATNLTPKEEPIISGETFVLIKIELPNERKKKKK